MKLTICPVCRSTVVLYEGDPPDTAPLQFKNRCIAHPLSGKPATGSRGASVPGHHSWWPPLHKAHGYCGAPVTDTCGKIIPVIIPLDLFVDITRYCFQLTDLQKMAYVNHPELLRLAQQDNQG